jgi:hypothetical protein
VSKWQYWSLVAQYGSPPGKWRQKDEDWYIEFSGGTIWVGIAKILDNFGDQGYEVFNVIPEVSINGPGWTRVGSYRFFAKKPA